MSYPSAWISNITLSSGYKVYVTMWDSLSGNRTLINADIETKAIL
jgi:hypothetical protein